ncbi:MAG TPA: hypothetical protein P5559_06835, partial [Candidatus Limiplasma sp.]|nr:hypothetical protein [Candidatus Limiplasma sp.]
DFDGDLGARRKRAFHQVVFEDLIREIHECPPSSWVPRPAFSRPAAWAAVRPAGIRQVRRRAFDTHGARIACIGRRI